MKTLAFFVGLLAFAFTLQLPILQQQRHQLWELKNQQLNENVGQDLLTKQRVILNLLQNVHQPSSVPEIEKVGLSFDIQANVQMYKNPQLVEDFIMLYSTTALPQGEIFSIFNEEHQKQAIAFTRLLMSAIDFDTFYKTAAWGRMFLNEGLYVYSVSVALVHRPDTYYIPLPPIYEIYPWYFYNVDVLQQIQQRTGIPVIKPGVSGLQGLIQYLQKITQPQQVPWQTQLKSTIPIVGSRLPGLLGFNQYLQGLIQSPQKLPQTPQMSEFPIGLENLPQYLQGMIQSQQVLPQLQQTIPMIKPGVAGLQQLLQHLQGLIPTQQVLPQIQPNIPVIKPVVTGLHQLIEHLKGLLQPQQGQWQTQQIPVVGSEMPGLHGLIQYLQGLVQTPQKLPLIQQTPEIPMVPGLEGLSPYLQEVLKTQQTLPQFQQTPYQHKQWSYPSQQGWLQSQHVPMQPQQVPFQYEQVPFQSQQIQPTIPTITKLLSLLTPSQMNTPIVQKYFHQTGILPSILSSQQSVPYSPLYLQQYEQLLNSIPKSMQKLSTVPSFLLPQQQSLYGPLPQSFPIEETTATPWQQVKVGRVQLEKDVPAVQYLNKWIRKVMLTSPKISPMTPGNVYTTQEREKVPLGQQQGITVIANYTLPSPMENPETLMSYFTEDVGLNALYFYYNIYFPSWMTNDEIIFSTQRRGEQFYYMTQQLLARYNLERISNGLPALPLLDFETIVPVGYQSTMVNSNGIPFPSRHDNVPIIPVVTQQVFDNSSMRMTNLRLYETRLLDAIDSGFVLTRHGRLVSIFEPQGFEILGDIIQANPHSPNVRFYGNIQFIVRNILGNANIPMDQYNIAPSVLQHLTTSLRDPAFYQLYNRIVYYFQRYKQYLPMYTQQELLLPGVQIQDVKVDKLVTYFDTFTTDITSSLTSPVEPIPIQIKQSRLSHQPFNYYLNVISELPHEVVVRVFLGPKNDITGTPIDISKNRLNFVELDKFKYTLVPGVNTIQRNSMQFGQVVPDSSTMKELFMQLVNPLSAPMQMVPSIQWSIPQRLLLPKGSPSGVTYQLYFLVTKAQPTQTFTTMKLQLQQPMLPWDIQLDDLPYGFPLDRPIDATVLNVPNSFIHEVMIYSEINPMFEDIPEFVRMQIPTQL